MLIVEASQILFESISESSQALFLTKLIPTNYPLC